MFKRINKKINYKNYDLYKSDILIYNMAKTGSTSITKTLEKYGLKVMKAHSLMNNFSTFFMSKEYCKSIRHNLKYHILNPLKKKITITNYRKIKSKKNLKIITLVRDPIARNISFFFHMLSYGKIIVFFNSKGHKRHLLDRKDYLNKLFKESINHDVPLNWFDKEFRQFTNIDIFKSNFNKESGYKIIREGNFSILLIKLEKLNQLLDVIGNFCSVSNFRLEKSNVGKEKWYGPIYKEFLDYYRPEGHYLKRLYDSKFMKHFYTDEEIKQFEKKWKKR